MRISIPLRLVIVGSIALILVSVVSAFAAGLSVTSSNAGKESIPVSAEDVKPSACDSLYLTNLVSGSGTLIGTTANDLITAALQSGHNRWLGWKRLHSGQWRG
jgi:hypothetical protein